MLNKYTAALLATVVFGVLFPLSFQVVAGTNPGPLPVAISAVMFFFSMLALFGKILRSRALHQG